MRQIDHHPQAIHLRNHFAAQRRQTIVVKIALRFSGIRIRKLAVAIVGQRHIARAPVVKLLYPFDVGPNGIAVLNADHGDP